MFIQSMNSFFEFIDSSQWTGIVIIRDLSRKNLLIGQIIHCYEAFIQNSILKELKSKKHHIVHDYIRICYSYAHQLFHIQDQSIKE